MPATDFKTICTRFVTLAAGLSVLLLLITSGYAFRVDFGRMHKLAEERYGPSGQQRVQDWHKLLDQLSQLRHKPQLEQINHFINQRVFYSEDLVVWKKNDYWATPLESFGRGAGDCEDSAIAKYFSLLRLGIPDTQLRLTYVRAKQAGGARAHMVLTYYPAADQEPLILDSLRNEILPASRRPDLFPIFSFNSSGLWVGGKPFQKETPSARLSNWRSVLTRMQEEGWQ